MGAAYPSGWSTRVGVSTKPVKRLDAWGYYSTTLATHTGLMGRCFLLWEVPTTEANMPNDLRNRILFLSLQERVRLATWLSQLEPVTAINRGRWTQLCDGSTDYVSHRELACLMDVATPCGFAMDIIRGTCRVEVTMA